MTVSNRPHHIAEAKDAIEKLCDVWPAEKVRVLAQGLLELATEARDDNADGDAMVRLRLHQGGLRGIDATVPRRLA